MCEGKRPLLVRTLLVFAAETSSENGRQGRKWREFEVTGLEFEVTVQIKSGKFQQEKLEIMTSCFLLHHRLWDHHVELRAASCFVQSARI